MSSNPTSLRESIDRVSSEDYTQMIDVWERSVRATHHFLAEGDIADIKPRVQGELEGLADVFCIRDEAGRVAGFIGFDHGKIEALFVDPSWQRAGIGRKLCDYAMKVGDATLVDVNEANRQAIDFYLHIGFFVESRSAVDSAGRPFPLLHLRYDLFATR
jgi:putative acetyltransferase